MNYKEFQKYLRRDKWCLHCGRQDDTLVPQHRKSRQSGGSKSSSTNGMANIIVMCSEFNGLMESDAKAAQLAREMGWKLSQYQSPDFEPVFDVSTDSWWLLENDGTRHVALVD